MFTSEQKWLRQENDKGRTGACVFDHRLIHYSFHFIAYTESLASFPFSSPTAGLLSHFLFV